MASLLNGTLPYPVPDKSGTATASVVRFSPVTFSAQDGIDQ